MGWSLGYDEKWKRWVGYGVPATCDHPGCTEEIDRGLGYVCGSGPYGGEHGCGLYFCHEQGHLTWPEIPWGAEEGVRFCERCAEAIGQIGVSADGEIEMLAVEPFEPSPDTEDWLRHMLNHESWAEWREENPVEVAKMREALVA